MVENVLKTEATCRYEDNLLCDNLIIEEQAATGAVSRQVPIYLETLHLTQ